MVPQPLAEVFGYPIGNRSEDANRHLKDKLCPFGNHSPNCTKDSIERPLGVCSVLHGGGAVITCPVRFREGGKIVSDAADFFFPDREVNDRSYTSVREIRLLDADGKSAGNIDVVLIEYDRRGRITGFGALEVQAVYISGNVRNPFEHFMGHRNDEHFVMEWPRRAGYPSPDYLSSSRKRLVPQLLYKGGILKTWQKKQAVAIQRSFFKTLPSFPILTGADVTKADIVWLLYDLELNTATNRYTLQLKEKVYSEFEPALHQIITPRVGPMERFVSVLQERLDTEVIKLDGDNPPDAPNLRDILDTGSEG